MRTINRSPTTSMVPLESVITTSASAASSSSAAVTPRLCQPLPLHECPAPLSIGRSPLAASILNPEGSVQCVDSSGFLGHCGNFSEVAILGIPASFSLSPSIRATFIQRWSFLFCDFALRVGPAITLNSNGKQRAQSQARYRKTGFGLVMSLNMPKRCRRRLDIALDLVQASFLSRMRLTFYWDM